MNALIMLGLPIVVAGGLLVTLMVMARIMPGAGLAKAPADVKVEAPARGPEYVQLTAKRTGAYRKGIVVLLGLGVLTVIEFTIAQITGSLVPMFIIGLLKAALIVQYFMHLYMVWTEEGAH